MGFVKDRVFVSFLPASLYELAVLINATVAEVTPNMLHQVGKKLTSGRISRYPRNHQWESQLSKMTDVKLFFYTITLQLII